MATCHSPIPEATLLDYWARDLVEGDEVDRVEEHLFACSDCSRRLEQMTSLGKGVATLVRQGRVSGIVSRALLNRLQRDGVRVRLYSLSPGETVACTVFPDDDLVVASLRADLSGVQAVTLSVTGPEDSAMGKVDEVPVSASDGEVCWALAGAAVRQMPSMRLRLTLTTAGDFPSVLGEYVLDHTAPTPPMDRP